MGSEKDNSCNETQLNAQTKIGLTFGQIVSLLIVAGSFGIGYQSLNSRITALESNNAVVKTMSEKQEKMNETLARIEEKLNTKQDKYEKVN